MFSVDASFAKDALDSGPAISQVALVPIAQGRGWLLDLQVKVSWPGAANPTRLPLCQTLTSCRKCLVVGDLRE